MSTTTSTGHTITVRGEHIEIAGDLDSMDRIPEAEINAACAAAGVTCTWEPTSPTSYRVRLDAAGYEMQTFADDARHAEIVATLTEMEIRALRAEAREAGDEAQVVLCDRAIAGDEAARGRCARAIAAARAME